MLQRLNIQALILQPLSFSQATSQLQPKWWNQQKIIIRAIWTPLKLAKFFLVGPTTWLWVTATHRTQSNTKAPQNSLRTPLGQEKPPDRRNSGEPPTPTPTPTPSNQLDNGHHTNDCHTNTPTRAEKRPLQEERQPTYKQESKKLVWTPELAIKPPNVKEQHPTGTTKADCTTTKRDTPLRQKDIPNFGDHQGKQRRPRKRATIRQRTSKEHQIWQTSQQHKNQQDREKPEYQAQQCTATNAPQTNPSNWAQKENYWQPHPKRRGQLMGATERTENHHTDNKHETGGGHQHNVRCSPQDWPGSMVQAVPESKDVRRTRNQSHLQPQQEIPRPTQSHQINLRHGERL